MGTLEVNLFTREDVLGSLPSLDIVLITPYFILTRIRICGIDGVHVGSEVLVLVNRSASGGALKCLMGV